MDSIVLIWFWTSLVIFAKYAIFVFDTLFKLFTVKFPTVAFTVFDNNGWYVLAILVNCPWTSLVMFAKYAIFVFDTLFKLFTVKFAIVAFTVFDNNGW